MPTQAPDSIETQTVRSKEESKALNASLPSLPGTATAAKMKDDPEGYTNDLLALVDKGPVVFVDIPLMGKTKVVTDLGLATESGMIQNSYKGKLNSVPKFLSREGPFHRETKDPSYQAAKDLYMPVFKPENVRAHASNTRQIVKEMIGELDGNMGIEEWCTRLSLRSNMKLVFGSEPSTLGMEKALQIEKGMGDASLIGMMLPDGLANIAAAMMDEETVTGKIGNFFGRLIFSVGKVRDGLELAAKGMVTSFVMDQTTRNTILGKMLSKVDKYSEGFISGIITSMMIATQGTSLSFQTSVHLAMNENPELRKHIYEELLSSSVNTPITRSFLLEILRTTPPAYNILRVADKDYKDKTGRIVVQKGENILFPITVYCKDPRRVEQPNVFDPTRYLIDNGNGGFDVVNWREVDGLNMVGGIGPRACPGIEASIQTAIETLRVFAEEGIVLNIEKGNTKRVGPGVQHLKEDLKVTVVEG